MSDPSNFGNIEAAFVRLEGKIDRLVDKMDHIVDENIRLRDRVHDLANDVAPLVMFDIPLKITGHETRIAALEADREQRKGAMLVMKGLWALVGFICGGSIIAAVQYLGG